MGVAVHSRGQVRRPAAFIILGGLCLLAAIALRLWDPSAIVALRDHVFTGYQQLAPKALKAAAPVKIIAIDTESQRRFGGLPWSGAQLAPLLQKLSRANPAAIGLAQPAPSNTTANLGQQIEGLIADSNGPERQSLQVLAAPLIAELTAANSRPPQWQTGSIVWATDNAAQATPAKTLPDGAFISGFTPLADARPLAQQPKSQRQPLTAILPGAAVDPRRQTAPRTPLPSRLPMLYRHGNQAYAHLAAALVARAQGVGHFDLQKPVSRLPWPDSLFGDLQLNIGDLQVTLDRQARLRVYDAGEITISSIPAWKILSGETSVEALQGQILLIGRTGENGGPLLRTGQAVSQILRGSALSRPAYGTALEIAVLCFGAVLAAFLIYISGTLQGLLLALTVAGGFAFASWLSFEGRGLLLDPLYPTLGIALIVGVSTLLRQLQRHSERARTRQVFAARLAPALIEELQSHSAWQTFAPQTRELTLMHCRIDGLPDFSGHVQQPARRFSRAATRLFDIVDETFLEHRGFIEHFEGTAVTVAWNTPISDPDHAYHAATAVLALTQQLRQFNNRMEKTARQNNRGYRPLNFSCGIATDTALVGDLALKGRRDFAIASPARDQARQLQFAAQKAGLSCLISAPTASDISDLAILQVGAALMPPRPPRTPNGEELAEDAASQANAFALLGDEVMRRSETFRRLQISHERMLGAIANGDIREAESLLKTCHILGGSQLSGFYRMVAANLRFVRQKAEAA